MKSHTPAIKQRFLLNHTPLQREEFGMANESQEVVTFASEEEKIKAIDAFDESTGDSTELEKIMNAEIKVPEPKDEETPPEPQKEPEPEPEPKEITPPEPEKKPDLPQEFTIKREDLPERFRDKSPQEVFKSHLSQDDLIERQGKKIQELTEQLAQSRHVTKEAEIELKDTQKKVGVEQKAAEESDDIPDSKLSEIMSLREELSKVEEGEELELDVLRKKDKLTFLLIEENQRNAMIGNKANETAQSLRKALTDLETRQEQSSLAERNRSELKKQYDEMDEFSGMDEFKEEYGMSVSAAEADQKYIDWRNKVAYQYYGFLPNDQTEEGRSQLNYAMYMLDQKSPDLIGKLKEATIPIEPDNDLKNYIKLCKLLDERDCVRYDPVTKQTIQLTRYNPKTGKHEAVSFPSLKATIEHKRVESGYYKDKMLKANKQGAQSMVDAMNKRDTKELENDTGSAAEAQMSVEDAVKTINDFDMEAAGKKYYETRDASVFDSYNAAMVVLGQPKMDISNLPTK